MGFRRDFIFQFFLGGEVKNICFYQKKNFSQHFLNPNFFGVQNLLGPKTCFNLKILLDPKFCWAQISFGTKILWSQNSVITNVWTQKCSWLKILCDPPSFFQTQDFFWSKLFYRPKHIFWHNSNFQTRMFFNPNIYPDKFFWDPKCFLNHNFLHKPFWDLETWRHPLEIKDKLGPEDPPPPKRST